MIYSEISDREIEETIFKIAKDWDYVHRRSLAYNLIVCYLKKPAPFPGTTTEQRTKNLAALEEFERNRLEPIVSRLLSEKRLVHTLSCSELLYFPEMLDA